MSRQELIWQARAHKCASRSPLRQLGRQQSRVLKRTNDENAVVDCVFISQTLFYIKRDMFNVTDVSISCRKKREREPQTKTAYADTFNWHFCILHSIVDSQLQLIVEFVSVLISVCVCVRGIQRGNCLGIVIGGLFLTLPTPKRCLFLKSSLSIGNPQTLGVCLSLLATCFEKSVSTSLAHTCLRGNEEMFLSSNKVPVVRVTHQRITDRNTVARAKQPPPQDPNGQLHPAKDTQIYSHVHTHIHGHP